MLSLQWGQQKKPAIRVPQFFMPVCLFSSLDRGNNIPEPIPVNLPAASTHDC
jgi:hypothetical protein